MLDILCKYAYTTDMKSEFIKEDVIAKLGGIKSATEFFNCTRQAIYQWKDGKPVPEVRQLQCKLKRPELFN